jgi:signal transduction histidine kinase
MESSSSTPDSADLPAASAARLERVLAASRAFLAVAGLVAIYIDPAQPARLQTLTYSLLVAYACYSIGAWLLVIRLGRLSRLHTFALQGIDILWASVFTLVSAGAVSPFFLFFVFALLSASYRWGFRGTLGTTLVAVLIYVAEAGLALIGPWKSSVFETLDVDGTVTILRVAYLSIAGVLLGYLAEQQKVTSAESVAVASLAKGAALGFGLEAPVTAVARTLLALEGVEGVAIVVRETDGLQAVLFEARTGMSADDRIARAPLSAEDEKRWLGAGPAHGWHIWRSEPSQRQPTCYYSQEGAWRLQRGDAGEGAVPPGDWRGVTAVDLAASDMWHARIYVFGEVPRRGVERRVHFLQAIGDQASTVLTNAVLLRRLRAQATSEERARVARELHDGVIQSLFAADVKLEVLSREAGADGALTSGLREVQELVRREVIELRGLLLALRPYVIDTSEQLPDRLAEVVGRFERETGIRARFVKMGEPHLEVWRANELLRIAQEALVNARRHSGARQVLVRLLASEHQCQLVVEDDGRGFAFEGRLDEQSLARRGVGPLVIRERAQLIGAALVIESTPGAGSRLEVSVAGGTHA